MLILVCLLTDAKVVVVLSRQMFDHNKVRVTVSSPISPSRVLEYNMDTKSMVCCMRRIH